MTATAKYLSYVSCCDDNEQYHFTYHHPTEVKEAMQRIHDRGNIGKLILDVEKAPTPLMANDSTETSEAGEEEEDHEGDSENKERMPFIQ
ncbi:Synaptic Vesicle Membrane Protein Vat-1-like-Like [Manis pentadactyla]|nr:Synaptic Vesicle Membrane Protein Vat-1-like-Like [Manis pentadactyla]